MADIALVKYTALLLLTLGCSPTAFCKPCQCSTEDIEIPEPWEVNKDIDPSTVPDAATGRDGTPFFDGDMLLTEKQAEHAFENQPPGCSRVRRALGPVHSYWPNATVPYTFDTILSMDTLISDIGREALQDAMEYISSRSCVRFRERQAADDEYLLFTSEFGCWSYIGMLGDGEGQKLSLGGGCTTFGYALHELLHALGFYHEQLRPDRDEFITVNRSNVDAQKWSNFDKLATSQSTDSPYDYESLMHFTKDAWNLHGATTIEVKGIGSKLKLEIGQRSGLSVIDLSQLRKLYNCEQDMAVCPDGWIWEGQSCYNFMSASQLSFKNACSYCQEHGAALLHIETQTENEYIKNKIMTLYPDILTWRTGGCKKSQGYIWYTATKQQKKEMTFTDWKEGQEPTESSMVLVFNNIDRSMAWEEVPKSSKFPFICERKANRRACSVLSPEFPDGREYRGSLDYTIDGFTCQKWSSQYPQNHTYLEYPFHTDDENVHLDGLGDHNYCRNPAKDDVRRDQPWCFTVKTSVEWQYCDVTVCRT